MILQSIHNYVAGRLPIEDVRLNWDSSGYTTEFFNRWVEDPEFPGWPGELPTEDETAVIVRMLNAQPGDRLLDLACGYGRHALELAGRHGLNVTGVDLSPGLITAARRRAFEQGLEIAFEVNDARNIRFNGEFDHVVVAFNSFSLFSPEDAPWVLRGIHNALRPEGRLFMDLDNKNFNPDVNPQYREWYLSPGGLTLQEVHYHEDLSVEVMRDLIITSDSESVKEFIIFKRLYSRAEIEEMFLSCGLRVVQSCGSWDLSPQQEDSSKIILVAAKR